jgi:hypothetical protein
VPGGRRGLQNRCPDTSCRGVGSIPTLSAKFPLASYAPDPVTVELARLAHRDEARHVASGNEHVRYVLQTEPEKRRALAAAVERRSPISYLKSHNILTRAEGADQSGPTTHAAQSAASVSAELSEVLWTEVGQLVLLPVRPEILDRV